MIKLYKKLKDKIGINRIFFLIVCIIFLGVLIFDPANIFNILKYFGDNLLSLIPILLLVYVIIFVSSILISNNKIANFLDHGHYIKKMFFAIIGGIISSGPIYLRYGFLRNLHKSGLSLGHVAGFSYARAIKIPLFPMMIVYFGIKFTLIFICILFILSFIQCIIIDWIDRYSPLV